jgi:SAM-dependent methyltransferase
MREMPLPSGSFDAAVSVAAIDHLNGDGVRKALSEVARVLKDDGEFLFITLNVDPWVRIAFPFPPGHGYFATEQQAERWRSRLETAGLKVVEEGTRPATMYFVSRKRGAGVLTDGHSSDDSTSPDIGLTRQSVLQPGPKHPG